MSYQFKIGEKVRIDDVGIVGIVAGIIKETGMVRVRMPSDDGSFSNLDSSWGGLQDCFFTPDSLEPYSEEPPIQPGDEVELIHSLIGKRLTRGRKGVVDSMRSEGFALVHFYGQSTLLVAPVQSLRKIHKETKQEQGLSEEELEWASQNQW